MNGLPWKSLLAGIALLMATIAPVESQEDVGTLPLPHINGWLRYDHGGYANWLGWKYRNNTLREPINVIIIDRYSQTRLAAIEKLMAECKIAGYGEEFGHSSGYCALIDNAVYPQIPNNRHMAFADHDFFRTNNHGRIFGPARYNDMFVFVAAFSRERPSILKGFEHAFVSFNLARDDFYAKMAGHSIYKGVGRVYLSNIMNAGGLTTGDHDGYAVILAADR